MAFVPATPYIDSPSTATPLSATGLNTRLAEVATYADTKASRANLALNVKEDYGAVGNGVANDTTAINNAIIAASAAGSATKRIRLTFPDGIYMTDGILVKSNVWLDFGNAYLKKRSASASTPTNSLMRTIQVLTGATYYGTYSNIKITGGIFDPNGFDCTANIINLIYVDNLDIDGVTVQHDPVCTHWAMQLGGRNGNVTNCKIKDGSLVFQDGIHIYHGQNWRVTNNDIESGDDAIGLGPGFADPYISTDPDPIRYVSIINNVVRSQRGHALRLYVDAGASGLLWEITDINVVGLTGEAGLSRNGGIFLQDVDAPAAGTSMIKRVNVSGVKLNVGSTAHDDVNAWGIKVQSASEVTVSDVDMQITDKTAAAAGFDLCIIRDSEDVIIDGLRCNALQKRYGVDARDSNRITVRNCKLRVTSATTLQAMNFDDVVDLKLLDNNILDVKDTTNAILLTTGTTTTPIIRGNVVKHAAGATTGYAIAVVSTALVAPIIEGNDFTGSPQTVNVASLPAGAIVRSNKGMSDFSAVPVIGSVAALTPSLMADVMTVSGITNITSITATGFNGRTITLIFSGILTVTDGSNLKLVGNFVTAANSTMTLVCDGTNWYELSRAANG